MTPFHSTAGRSLARASFAFGIAIAVMLVGRIVADAKAPPTTSTADITSKTITIEQGKSMLTAYLARPAGDRPAPGLILVHEWWGLNDWVKQQADRFARNGYVALAVDLYRGEVAEDREHAHELMRGLADERAIADLRSAFAYLSGGERTRGCGIGAIGWCMGGGYALKLAIAEPKLACTIVCYGRPVTDVSQLRRIAGPLLGIWGETDRGIDVDSFKKALAEAKVRADNHVYPGAGHAFLNENNARGYHKEQAAKAWAEIDAFLERTLKSRRE
ncbi:MAG: dienelactone hydrolase family protein [Phycisphaerae bacterium]|nr:dienelactone hydrolase family protein [Phycisphaerae bacterium]